MAEANPPRSGTAERLAAARAELARVGGDALLLLTGDPHLSEYVPERWTGRAWLSGFRGSAGSFAVTAKATALFVDSRYWIEANAQFAGSGVEVVRISQDRPEPYIAWLIEHVPSGGTVVTDGDVLPLAAGLRLEHALERAGRKLRLDIDLLDAIWSGRPSLPEAPVWAHPEPYAARPRAAKLAAVRAEMAARGATHHLIGTLDDVAWITNLRGADIAHNPVFLSYLLIGPDRATLFVGAGKLWPELVSALAADGIVVAPYEHVHDALADLPADARLLIDPARTTLGLRRRIPSRVEVTEAVNPAILIKSRKTAEELAHFRDAMAEDGAAICRFMAEFEASRAAGEPWSEWRVHERLTAARAQSPIFVDLSFHTNAGFNANGALPHYSVRPQNAAQIAGDGLLLIDSGGQYLGGTTDITRVWAIGSPSDAMRRDATRALRALIAYSSAQFPLGTPGPLLDAIARAPLWADGLDYAHGTGHGVGYFLNVHEPPHLLSGRRVEPEMALLPGMVTAIEPGIYRPGEWGVRYENIAVPFEAERNDWGCFLRWETLTMCPFDRRCLLPELMTDAEIAWIDAYHARVREALFDRLDGDARAWLVTHTAPIAAG